MTNIEPISDMAQPRRRFFGTVAAVFAAAQWAAAEWGTAQASTLAQTSPAGSPPFGPLRSVHAGDLDVGYVETGRENGAAIILLHGWPYDIYSFADAAIQLGKKGFRVIVPYLRGFGSTRFLSDGTVRNGQPAALAADVLALMDALKLDKAVLAGFDWGARTADIVAALWPERCAGLVSVSGYLIGSQQAGKLPLPPGAELAWWYQFYFATDRGRDGYAKYRREFAKLIWHLASPRWKFDDATFDRSATAFDNPDHVDIVIHNYRWRLGLAKGEARFDALEAKLAASPTIAVPTITMEGDANGAPHPEANTYRNKFSGAYEHRLVIGGVGHNLPQEAPNDFVKAVLDISKQQ